MLQLKTALDYFLGFQPFVMLPIIIFTFALFFRIKLSTAVRSALQIGIAFIGIFMTIDYFVKLMNPAIKALIAKSGLNVPVLDIGWPPLANITWSFNFAPLLLLLFIAINVMMLLSRTTKVVNIDIWNYWHVIFLGAFIYHTTDSLTLTLIFSSISFILTLKIADWSAPLTNSLMNMDGICIPHLSSNIHFPIAYFLSKQLDRIPFIRNNDANPAFVQKKLGILGEPMIIGFILGILLGIASGYDLEALLTLAFGFAAVIYILPKMGGILGESLIPISEGMKEFIATRFPKLGQTYIGLDVAVLFSNPSVIVVALLLIPTSIGLALILPGINFIPMADLTNLLVPVAMISVATKGNMIKSYIIGVPIVAGTLYYASFFAQTFTTMSIESNLVIEGYDGVFTSFLDGGNLYRGWLVNLLQLDTISLIAFPFIVYLLIYTWKSTKKELVK